MKPTNVLSIERHGDFGGQKIAMGIDAASLAHVMSVLTDLYSNTVLAVIREYSTNALDSHIDAGVSRPIEVMLPSAMNPFFKVRDFGLGLSVDDIYKVYSQYGASTKRDRDSVNGMLGLGCKSALTYASQFTIVSIKDGMKIHVIVSRSEDGSAGMEIVDTSETREGNGVEITVPVKHGDANRFHAEAANFYQYWNLGTVLVNNEAPKRIAFKAITPEIGMIEGERGDDVVVMGGVAYPVKEPGLYAGNRSHSNPFRLVAFIDASDDLHKVNFTPSREALTYSGVTPPTLARLRASFESAIKVSIQDDVDSYTQPNEAYKAMAKWRDQFDSNMVKDITYLGDAIPTEFTMKAVIWNDGYGRSPVNYSNYNTDPGLPGKRFAHEAVSKSMVFVGYTGVQISSAYKAKIREYKRIHGINGATYYLFIDSNPDPKWISGDTVVAWEDVKAIRLGGPSGTRSPRNPKFPVYDPADGYSTTAIDLDSKKTLLYVSPKTRMTPNSVKALYKAFPNIQIFCLGENRWDKFKRENPNSNHLSTWVANEVKKSRAALTTDDILIIQMGSTYHNYSRIEADKIDDPALSKVIRIRQGKLTTPAVERYTAVKSAAQNIGHYERELPSVTDKTLEGYPLLSDPYSTIAKQHVIFYVNAVYAARQNGVL